MFSIKCSDAVAVDIMQMLLFIQEPHPMGNIFSFKFNIFY